VLIGPSGETGGTLVEVVVSDAEVLGVSDAVELVEISEVGALVVGSALVVAELEVVEVEDDVVEVVDEVVLRYCQQDQLSRANSTYVVVE